MTPNMCVYSFRKFGFNVFKLNSGKNFVYGRTDRQTMWFQYNPLNFVSGIWARDIWAEKKPHSGHLSDSLNILNFFFCSSMKDGERKSWIFAQMINAGGYKMFFFIFCVQFFSTNLSRAVIQSVHQFQYAMCLWSMLRRWSGVEWTFFHPKC